MDFDEDKSNIWLVYCENGQRLCIVTSDEDECNWIREVEPGDASKTSNVFTVSTDDELYLITGSQGVPPFSKLK